jgi:surface protein
MNHLFADGNSFVGGNLSQWNTGNVETMSFIFSRCKVFRGDVSLWDVSKVTDVQSAFEFCFEFDGDVSAWNTGNVANMQRMFKDAWVLSSNVSNWNTAKVTVTSEMVGRIFVTLHTVCEQQSNTADSVFECKNVQCGYFAVGRVELGGCHTNVSRSRKL